MISRRKFVSLGAVATLGAKLLASPGKVFGLIARPDDLDWLSAEHFRQFVGTHFTARRGGSKTFSTLRLLDVRVMRHKADAENGIQGEAFSLLFRAEGESGIKGEICNISHEGLGKFSLFVSPVSDDPRIFESIVDRRRES